MNAKIEELTEALSGVLGEQKALQGYVVDFINAYNEKDASQMLQSLRGAMTLCNMFLAEHDKSPGIAEALRHMRKAVECISEATAKNARNKNRRNR